MSFNKLKRIKPVSKGFTLLELIIAVAIFGLLMVMMNLSLNNTLLGSRITEEAIKEMQELQLAMFILQRDINQIIDRPIRDAFGDTQAAIKTGNGFDSVLDLTRSGWSNPAGLVRSNLQRVSYAFEDETLSRIFWSNLDQPSEAVPLRSKILAGVKDVRFRYFDKENRWHDQWPPMQSLGAGFNELPRAVEVTIDTEMYGELKRLLLLPL